MTASSQIKEREFAIYSYTARGRELAAQIEAFLLAEGYLCIQAEVKEAFARCEALVFVGASGIAVRKIAPFVRDKFQDPAVLSLDEYGRFVIPLLSGHVGGANELARLIGRKIGAAVAISTATDLNGRFAVDVFAKKNKLVITSRTMAKEISAALLRGESVAFESDFPLRENEKLPAGLYAGKAEAERLSIRVSARAETAPSACLQLIPKIYVLGVGCRRNTPVDSLKQAALRFLKEQNISKEALFLLASIDLKRDEAAVLALAKNLKLPTRFFTAEELAAVPGAFESSDFVKKTTGVGAVAARAAARCAPIQLAGKTVVDGATFALYREDFSPGFHSERRFVFVAGARYQGKRHFAERLCREGQITGFRAVPDEVTEALTEALLIDDRAAFEAALSGSVRALADAARGSGEALLLASIGGGLVPIDRRERALRDAVGRLQCALAAEADEVYLLELGLARALKKFGESVEKL